MERIFALIQGTSVVNSVVADDSFIEFIKNDYTDIIETTNMDPKPGITAVYDKETNTFSYPVPLIVQSIIDEEQTTEQETI